MFTAQGSRMPKEANFAAKVQKINDMCKYFEDYFENNRFIYSIWRAGISGDKSAAKHSSAVVSHITCAQF